MDFSKIPFLILLSIVILPKISAQFAFRHSWCGDTTYTPNSTYQSNLKSVLQSLSSNTQITYGFYNFTAGKVPDRVSSLALCRGDVPVGTCRICIIDSVNLLPQSCPNQKEAFGYSEYCSLFVSNRFLYGNVQDMKPWWLTDDPISNGIVGFNRSLNELMSSLQNQAAFGNSELKFATGQANLTGGGSLYGLVQCTPDLSRVSCIQCVKGLIDFFPTCCIQPSSTASSVRIIVPSCDIRYGLSKFYGNVPNLQPPPPPPRSPPQSPPLFSDFNGTSRAVGGKKKSFNASVVAIPIAGSIVLLVVASLCILLRRKKQKKSWVKFNKDEIDVLESLQFSLSAIKHATDNFSDDTKLGQGGFGTVYKGVLPDGQEIAVKRLSGNSGEQGDVQFKNEILVMAKLQHRNLARLLGFCLHQDESLLIFEFVPNRSLDNFLFDRVQCKYMLWDTRHRIINGIARGLVYLHEDSRLRIIHRDLKAGNVLLDAEFNPKIADFGMARLFNIDQTQAVASRIMGTYGYMAPEYVLQGQVSVKSDVFSFGVLLLEIISGQRISSFMNEENPENLLSFAWKSWVEDSAWNLVDPTLSDGYSTEILRCYHIGLLCVQENPGDRPTMSSVVLMLSSYSLSLQVPLQPAFFIEGNTGSNVPPQENTSTQSTSRSANCSVNQVSITELYPR